MRPGGGSHTGAGLFVFCLVAATDKDQSNTSLLSLLLLLLLLEARPLNRDKVGVCECMCVSQSTGVRRHSPTVLPLRSRPFVERGGCHSAPHHVLHPLQCAYNVSARGACAISRRAHEFTRREASCSRVDVH